LIRWVKTAAPFLFPPVRKKTGEERRFEGFAEELTAGTMEPFVFVCLSGQFPLVLPAVTWVLTALAGREVKVNGQGDNLLTMAIFRGKR
jgi:hypothetical protein